SVPVQNDEALRLHRAYISGRRVFGPILFEKGQQLFGGKPCVGLAVGIIHEQPVTPLSLHLAVWNDTSLDRADVMPIRKSPRNGTKFERHFIRHAPERKHRVRMA